MLLSGFLYALLSLSDQLLLSFALVFASVLHDFISLTEGNVSG